MYQTAATLGQALQLAKNAVSKEDLICITGSFYLIGQAKYASSRTNTATNSMCILNLLFHTLIFDLQ